MGSFATKLKINCAKRAFCSLGHISNRVNRATVQKSDEVGPWNWLGR